MTLTLHIAGGQPAAGAPATEAGAASWRLETACGMPLADPDALTTSWRRRPHAVAIELVERQPCTRADDHEASEVRRVIGRAVIGTRCQLAALRTHAFDVGAILVERARRDGQALLADPLPARRRRQQAAQFGGAVREALDLWRDRMLIERWRVGVAERPLDAALGAGLGRIRWMKAHSLAAPAPWGANRVLCEEKISGGRFRLLALSGDRDGGLARSRILLERDHHVSHPSLVTLGGRTWVLPSTPDVGATTLWRLSDRGGLAAVAEIAPGRRLADPTLFLLDGLWWIACTDLAIGAEDNLCLYHAVRPEGPWVPHRLNPVKIDIRSSRPAGAPFHAEGRLHRPAQDCSATSGGAVMLNLVERLTPTVFSERPIRRLGPDRIMRDGLHAASSWNGRTLVDGKRLVFEPRHALATAMAMLRRRGMALLHAPRQG